MRNILIISYVFPPMPAIGGVRIYGLAKNLPLYQWNPIILSRDLPGYPDERFSVIQIPHYVFIEKIKKAMGLNPKKALQKPIKFSTNKNNKSIVEYCIFFISEILTYPDSQRGWYRNAISGCEQILESTKVDVIISSSYPVTCHLVAKKISLKYKIPWVADFRDLWTQNPYFTHSWVRRKLEIQLERKTIKNTSALTTVSQPLAEKLKDLHKNKPIYTILNGFDPDLVSTNRIPDNLFRIVYTGHMYQGKRDPEPLFAAIQELLTTQLIKQSEIKIDFYGQYEDWLCEDVYRYHLEDIVTLHGHVPWDIAIAEQQKAQLLLLLTWDNPEERGVYTGKLFDYLAASRPILAMGYTEGGVVEQLLDQTQAGVYVSNNAELKDYLLKAYTEYKELGAVQYRGIMEEVMKYSHKEMAKMFAEVLDDMSG